MTHEVFAKTETTVNEVHLMVDLETLGVRPTAPIISIGAVLFDPKGNDTFQKLYDRAFLRLVDIEDSIRVCGPAEGSTIKWWFSQSDAAIKRLLGEALLTQDAVRDLWAYSHARGPIHRDQTWINSLPVPTRIWAKDPDFDCKILQHASDQTKQKFPFHFSACRSVRTIQDLGFPNGELPSFDDGRGENEIVAHDARDDAVMQALMVQACYRSLGLSHDGVEFHKW